MSILFSRLPKPVRWFLWTSSPSARFRIESGSTLPAVLRKLETSESQASDLYEAELERLDEGQSILFRGDDAFPARLERLGDKTPECIYTHGNVAKGPSFAIVGSRAADAEGLRITQRLSRELSRHGIIVSGGALGVDATAHRACLQAFGTTTVVLPSGLDRLSPRRNEALFADAVAAGGCLVSETRLGTTVRKYSFRRRNQLLVALSDLVIVVRTKTKGGTMISADFATELGVPLYAVPGSPEDLCAIGCLELILSERAKPMWRADQIGFDPAQLAPSPVQPDLSPGTAQVLQGIRELQTPMFQVGDVTSVLAPSRVSAAFYELEVLGYLRKTDETDSWQLTEGFIDT